MSNTSLSRQLSWRVGVVQVITFLVSLAIFVAVLWKPDVREVPQSFAQSVASAIRIENGQLFLARDKLPPAFLAQEDNAWLVARGPSGQQITLGTVPDELADISRNLSSFQETQIRSDDSRLAATIAIVDSEQGPIRLMLGGTSEGTLKAFFLLMAQYIFLPMVVPVIVATAVLIPLVISHRLKGLRKLAADAATIDLGRRGAKLEGSEVPSEVTPLVASFNQALTNIWDASADRDRFLSDAAHELRMPMAVLRARLSSLPHSKDKLRLMGDLSRLETIAEQLLDLQRLTRAQTSFKLINITELCDDLAAEIAPLIIEQGYSLSFHAAETPLMIQGDAGSLERMFKNLLHNAITHGGQQGEIAFEVLTGGRVRVSDSGPGIPAQERQNIFAPFYRLNSSVSGSGLGLHLASEVAAKHGGMIRALESQSGGACFEVVLPSLASSVREAHDGHGRR